MSNIEWFKKLRAAWLAGNLDGETAALCRRNGIAIPSQEKESAPDTSSWGDWKWHLTNRLTDKNLDAFLSLFPKYQGKKELLKKYLESYNLSIPPLMLLLTEGVRSCLPSLDLIYAPDPNGVKKAKSVILRERDGKKVYLTTWKRGYHSFLPILGAGAGRLYCPLGCARCYRGPETRLNQPFTIEYKDGHQEKIWFPNPVDQIRMIVEDWNTRPELREVYDVLFSGGEPLMLPNSVWKKILLGMGKARYLRSFRICSGCLFLGLPFRFDDKFIQLLMEFRQRTGIQTKLAVNIYHPEQVTPEAAMFARHLVQAGIEIQPQCPIEPEVNFWINDIDRTIAALCRLDQLLALVVGTRPYKWILDMQRGIPLIAAIEVWTKLHDSHQGDSDITRPTSFSLFLPRWESNLNLSYHSLWALQMRVEGNEVVYLIPHPAGPVIEYREPIFPGINDNPGHLKALKAPR